ncbi:MAG TPA: hypothetical protein VIZ68_07385, partial [Thermoplasmata archaeon]
MAYDPLLGGYVLFGGCDAGDCWQNQTWVFALGAWHNVTNSLDSPAARSYAAMTFDAVAGGDLLFGGYGIVNGSFVEYTDTWLYRAGGWINETGPGPAPSGRIGPSLAFDPDPEENGSVLFGGCLGYAACDSTPWIWHPGSGWAAFGVPSWTPPGREFAAMAYDPALQALVLFGGYGPGSSVRELADTWELSAGTWWSIDASSPPPGRDSAAFGYDSALDAVLLFGGYDSWGGQFFNDTWAFSGAGWENLGLAPAPDARSNAAFASGGSSSPPVLFSGFDPIVGAVGNDTWVFEPPVSAAVTLAGISEASAPRSLVVDVAGGAPPYRATVEFGDGTSADAYGAGPALVVSHRFDAPGSFSVTAGVVDSVGVSTVALLSVAVVPGVAVSAGAEPDRIDVGRSVPFTA